MFRPTIDLVADPHWLDYVAAFGAAGAGLAAAATIWFARSAAHGARDSARAAATSAGTATQSLNEATRSRIDSSASMVTFTHGTIRGPLLLGTRSRLPGGGEPRLWDSVNVHGSVRDTDVDQPMALDETAGGLLYFVCTSLLRNEGTASAWIRPEGESRLREAIDPLAPAASRSLIAEPRMIRTSPQATWLLEPGQTAVLQTYLGRTLGDWIKAYNDPADIAHGRCYSTVVVEDPRNRFFDHIFLEGSGRPVVPSPGPSQWHLENSFSIGILEVRRTYVSMGEQVGEPPWVSYDV